MDFKFGRKYKGFLTTYPPNLIITGPGRERVWKTPEQQQAPEGSKRVREGPKKYD
jgi:hypothetical protein